MIFQILANGNNFFQIDLFSLAISAFLIAAIVIGLIVFTWKKIAETETMKYEFLTIIAHKFRTPLTSLKWSVEGLLSSNIDSSAKEAVENIGNSAEKLISLTGTMIELTDN